MCSVVLTITTNGHIAIPAEVRRHLSVGEHDRSAFVIENDRVQLQLAKFASASAYGSAKPTVTHKVLETLTAHQRGGKPTV